MEQRSQVLLHRVIEAVTDAHPDAPALRWLGRSIPYGLLDQAADGVHDRLSSVGVRRGDHVFIAAHRGPAWVAALLGILKAGAAVVPLDIGESEVRWPRLSARTRPTVLVAADLDEHVSAKLTPGLSLVEVRSDDLQSTTQRKCVKLPETAIAFAFSTSGSTGAPRSVLHSHASATIGLLPGNVRTELVAHDRILVSAPANSLRMMGELFKPLLAGACAVLAQDHEVRDLAGLLNLIVDEKISVLNSTPTVLRLLTQEPKFRSAVDLRHVYASAEPLTPEFVQSFAKVSAARLHTGYGLTECAPVSSWDGESLGDATNAPLGRSAPLALIRVLDERLREVPPGDVGELWVGGPSLAIGYANAPAETAQRFCPDPYSSSPGQRLYRTGDLAYRDEVGNLRFVGRSDNQLNVNGYRVDPTEVEQALLRHEAIAEAAVGLRGVKANDSILTAYLVPVASTPTGLPSLSALHAHLAALLPDRLWPRALIWLESMPYLPSGKLNRLALPALQSTVATARDRRPVDGVTAVERFVIEAAIPLLPPDGPMFIGLEDNFYGLGGNSVALMRLIADLNSLGRVQISSGEVLAEPTMAHIATAFAKALKDA